MKVSFARTCYCGEPDLIRGTTQFLLLCMHTHVFLSIRIYVRATGEHDDKKNYEDCAIFALLSPPSQSLSVLLYADAQTREDKTKKYV